MALTPEEIEAAIARAGGAVGGKAGGTTTKTGTATTTKAAYTPFTPTPRVDYNAENAKNQLAKGGHQAPPPGAILLNGGNRFYTQANDSIYKIDPRSGVYIFEGKPFKDDVAAIRTAMNAGQVQPGAGGAPPPAGTTPAPAQGITALPGSLQPYNGVQIGGFEQYMRPISGGIPGEGRQNLVQSGLNNPLNQIQAGRQGSATQFAVAPGMRGTGDVGNSINFASGSYNPRTLEPQNLFPDVVANVPSSYVRGAGNTGDSNRMFELPFNIGPNGAAMAQIAGNNVQIQGAPGSGVGYGFALNAAPASNVGALTGRNLSEDPALQAIQTLMLNSAIAQGQMGNIMATNPQQFGGNPAGTSPYYGGGAQAQTPLGLGMTAQPEFPAPPPAPAIVPPVEDTSRFGGPRAMGGGGGTPAYNPWAQPNMPQTPAQLTTAANNLAHNFAAQSPLASLVPAAAANRALAAFGAGPLTGSAPPPAAPPSLNAPIAGQAGYTDWAAQQQRDAVAAAGPTGAGHPNYNMTANILGTAPSAAMAGPALMAAMQAATTDEERQAAMAAAGMGGYGSDGPQYAARGGSFDFRPLGSPASKSLVTTGPMGLVDLTTGQVKVVVGEDNADRDRLPDRERVTLTPTSMHVTPLDPPRMMAGGGQQMFQQQQQAPQTGPNWKGLYASLADYWQMTHPLYGPLMMAEGGSVNIDPGGIPVDSRTGVVPRVTSRADSPVGYVPPAPLPTLPPNQLFQNPAAPPTYTGDPALDPAILQPWQRAQQGLAQQQHLRDVVDEPRRRAAGFVANSATGIPIQQGEIPTGQLGPGMFYDLRPQVDRAVRDITNAQADIRRYGPAVDQESLFNQLNPLGIKQDAADRLRSMQLQKAGLEATNEIEKQQAAIEYTNAGNSLNAAQNAFNDANNAWSVNQSPENLQHVLDTQARLTSLQTNIQEALQRSTSDSPALVALRAQEAALQAQLGEGFNEAANQTQMALLQKQISDQQSRAKTVMELGNLAQAGVPALNAPILPVRAA